MSDPGVDAARTVRGVPPHIAAWIKGCGKSFDPGIVDATRELYVALHQRLPRPAVEFHADLAYGPDARHRFDLHLPPTGGGAALPVVMYFHAAVSLAARRIRPAV